MSNIKLSKKEQNKFVIPLVRRIYKKARDDLDSLNRELYIFTCDCKYNVDLRTYRVWREEAVFFQSRVCTEAERTKKVIKDIKMLTKGVRYVNYLKKLLERSDYLLERLDYFIKTKNKNNKKQKERRQREKEACY